MANKIVVYTDSNGWKWVTEVPANIIDERELRHGIRLGPPDLADLSELRLSKWDQKRLHNALAEANIYDYDAMNGRRREVLEIIQTEVPKIEAKTVLIYLISIYQRALTASETSPQDLYREQSSKSEE